VTALALALALAAAPPPVDRAASAEVLRRIYDGAKGAVVQVGGEASGAGVVVDEAGLVVTARALVKDQTTVAVTFTNGYRAKARVVATDEALGVALLRLDGLPPMAFVKVASTPPTSNQASYGLAWAKPLVPSINFARVASTQVVRDQQIDDHLFTVHFGFNPRSVGGAVLNWNGELLGVVLANDRSGTSFCVNVDALLALMAAHSENLPTTSLALTSDPSGAQVLLDGDPVGHTPLHDLRMLAGRHRLVLRSPGLPDAVRPLIALGRAHQQMALVLFPGAPVTVQTLERAEVWVDGVWRAVGPSTLWLPSGRHWVGVVLKGHHDYGRWLEVVEDRPLVVAAELPEQHATLSVDTTPHGADVSLDDNHLGVTPLQHLRVDPGVYELTLGARGYHTSHLPIRVRDGQDLDLGKVRLEAPHATLRVRGGRATEVSIDGGPRHPVSGLGEAVSPGPHRATFYAPFQYRSVVAFGGEDGQALEVTPTFVPAGDPDSRDRYVTLGGLTEGAGGIALLVGGIAFIAAATERSSAPTLTPTGHTEVAVGLTAGAVALTCFAGGALLNSFQPTPEMGWDSDPPASP
jgi:hypothetical protein